MNFVSYKSLQAMLRVLLCVAIVSVTYGCASSEEKAAEYVQSAQLLFDEQNYVKAALEVKNAIQIDPKNAKARYLAALIAEQQRDFQAMGENLPNRSFDFTRSTMLTAGQDRLAG